MRLWISEVEALLALPGSIHGLLDCKTSHLSIYASILQGAFTGHGGTHRSFRSSGLFSVTQ